jgi:D-beta-D-heptose 7-phosphate kinase/D-beta-D-heptose 1-phosphate adenosyltransferase
MSLMKNKIDIKKLVDQFSTFRVGVVGDLIVDAYVWGEASRISPEAPVPIVHVKSRNNTLGGAANVINNISHLGAKCFAYGIVGQDKNGKILTEMMNNLSCNTDGVLVDKSRCTTVKTRVIAATQQVVRIDEEELHNLDASIREELIAKIKSDIDQHLIDGLIFEDYNKGVLDRELVQELTDYARARGLVTAMDPHPGHPMNISNLTYITPNRNEAFALAGTYLSDGIIPVSDDAPLMHVGATLMKLWTPDLLLITLGSHGMAIFREGKEIHHIPTKAKDVFDVSGAGDTVISTLMLALLAGCNGVDAANIANHAAGVVVGHVGTVPIQLGEFVESFDL